MSEELLHMDWQLYQLRGHVNSLVCFDIKRKFKRYPGAVFKVSNKKTGPRYYFRFLYNTFVRPSRKRNIKEPHLTHIVQYTDLILTCVEMVYIMKYGLYSSQTEGKGDLDLFNEIFNTWQPIDEINMTKDTFEAMLTFQRMTEEV